MTKAPETIWIDDEPYEKHWHVGSPPSADRYAHFVGAYTRTDLFTAMQAERDEARRRRDEWRKKAEGFDALQSAVRQGIDEAGDRNLSRVFLRGALVVSEKERDAAIARAEKAEAATRQQQNEATCPTPSARS